MRKASIPYRALAERGRRIAALAVLALTFSTANGRSQEAIRPNQCALGGTEEAIVSGVTERLEINLADGRFVLIAGIEAPPPQGSPGQQARAVLSSWLAEKKVRLTTLMRAPDRWGRIMAHVHGDAGDGTFLSVAYALADAGWIRVRPHVEAAPCLAWFLEAEASARTRRDGLWGDPAFAVLQAGHTPSFLNRAGEWIVVEGRVHSVNETRNRTYLNFGPLRDVDLTVTIPKQFLRNFTSAGVVLKQFWG